MTFNLFVYLKNLIDRVQWRFAIKLVFNLMKKKSSKNLSIYVIFNHFLGNINSSKTFQQVVYKTIIMLRFRFVLDSLFLIFIFF